MDYPFDVIGAKGMVELAINALNGQYIQGQPVLFWGNEWNWADLYSTFGDPITLRLNLISGDTVTVRSQEPRSQMVLSSIDSFCQSWQPRISWVWNPNELNVGWPDHFAMIVGAMVRDILTDATDPSVLNRGWLVYGTEVRQHTDTNSGNTWYSRIIGVDAYLQDEALPIYPGLLVMWAMTGQWAARAGDGYGPLNITTPRMVRALATVNDDTIDATARLKIITDGLETSNGVSRSLWRGRTRRMSIQVPPWIHVMPSDGTIQTEVDRMCQALMKQALTRRVILDDSGGVDTENGTVQSGQAKE